MNTLVTYVRDLEGRPFATIVATGRGQLGVATCRPNDKFTKKLGREIATGRALKGVELEACYPETEKCVFEYQIEIMKERSRKYFKVVPAIQEVQV